VDHVVEPGEAHAAALEQARTWAAGPTKALGAAKAAVNAAVQTDRASGLRLEHDVFVRLFETHDKAEGTRAFLEKREPRFEGR
jgi:enoyl-CoA hydratase/carnithine racemase